MSDHLFDPGIFPDSMNNPPLIIGHRGASALAPENTLAAFARAMTDGADGVEFDVRLSNDGIPIVIHDATLARTASERSAVEDLSALQLSKVNVGSWFNRRFPTLARPEYDEQSVPSLESVFKQFSNTAAVMYVEMKCDNGVFDSLARACVELIHKYSLVDRTVVECFDLRAIARIKEFDNSVCTAALFEPTIKQPLSLLNNMWMIRKAQEANADELALHHRLITPQVVDRAKQENMPCIVWTVDEPRWVERAGSLGLKALITNNPRVMRG